MQSWTLVSFGITSVSVISWSLFDAARKELTRQTGLSATHLSVSMAFSQLPFFLIWAVWEQSPWPHADYWIPGGVGISANAAASVLFMKALAHTPLSKSIPILSFSPVFASWMGWAALGEAPGGLPLLGMFLITGGSFLLGAEPANLLQPWTLARALLSDTGCRQMLTVAALWALASLSDKMALQHTSVGLHALFQVTGVTAALFLVLLLRRQRLQPLLTPAKTLVFWAALISALSALTFQLLAIQTVQVGLFEGYKRAGGIVLSVLFGTLLFRERLTPSHTVGVLVMTIGSLLLFL